MSRTVTYCRSCSPYAIKVLRQQCVLLIKDARPTCRGIFSEVVVVVNVGKSRSMSFCVYELNFFDRMHITIMT